MRFREEFAKVKVYLIRETVPFSTEFHLAVNEGMPSTLRADKPNAKPVVFYDYQSHFDGFKKDFPTEKFNKASVKFAKKDDKPFIYVTHVEGLQIGGKNHVFGQTSPHYFTKSQLLPLDTRWAGWNAYGGHSLGVWLDEVKMRKAKRLFGVYLLTRFRGLKKFTFKKKPHSNDVKKKVKKHELIVAFDKNHFRLKVAKRKSFPFRIFRVVAYDKNGLALKFEKYGDLYKCWGVPKKVVLQIVDKVQTRRIPYSFSMGTHDKVRAKKLEDKLVEKSKTIIPGIPTY